MAYEKQTFENNSTVLTAEMMQHIEDGIAANSDALDEIAEARANGEFNGEDGQDGKDGADGVSPAITVSDITGGHRITIKDASGTKTVDVMDGEDGGTGADGADGVGIQSVAQTTTSTADGGENVITVTLTNGQTATFKVKNGSKGSTGETGANGKDGSDATVTATSVTDALGYTPAKQTDVDTLSKEKVDKANITLEQHTDGLIYIFVDGAPVGSGVELGTVVDGDVIGTLDENNNILLSGALVDGTYTLKYENEDGTVTDIGTLEVGEILKVTSISATKTKTTYTEGDTLTTDDITVTATYSDGSTATVTDYTVDSSAVQMGTAGNYNIVVSYGGFTAYIAITVEAAAEPVTVDIELTDGISITVDNGSDRTAAGYCATPLIDLREIPKPCTINLTKARWSFGSATDTGYVRFYVADTNGIKVITGYTHPDRMPSGVTMTLNGDLQSDVTVTVTSDGIGYIRFAGQWTGYSDSSDGFAAANTKATLTYTPA